MKKAVQEIINEVAKVCDENGYKFLIQIDDGENITGRYHVRTGSKLHAMGKVLNDLSDKYSETTTK